LKEDPSGVELGQDAAEGPEINTAIVGEAQDRLRGVVVAGLDVEGEGVGSAAAAAKVVEFDLVLAVRAHENIFWLDIAVDEIEIVHLPERHQKLFDDATQAGSMETNGLPVLQ